MLVLQPSARVKSKVPIGQSRAVFAVAASANVIVIAAPAQTTLVTVSMFSSRTPLTPVLSVAVMILVDFPGLISE